MSENVEQTQQENCRVWVNEMFHSIQGEGYWTGTPAYFLRLQGCNIGCTFCDSKDSWAPLKGREDTAEGVAKELNGYFREHPFLKHLVITGGEPSIQSKAVLHVVDNIPAFDGVIQIETAGREGDWFYNLGSITRFNKNELWITVSPKEYQCDPKAITWANELKFVVGDEKDIHCIHEFLVRHHVDVNKKIICVQPKDFLPEFHARPIQEGFKREQASKLSLGAAIQYNWRLSLQTHKWIGAR